MRFFIFVNFIHLRLHVDARRFKKSNDVLQGIVTIDNQRIELGLVGDVSRVLRTITLGKK